MQVTLFPLAVVVLLLSSFIVTLLNVIEGLPPMMLTVAVPIVPLYDKLFSVINICISLLAVGNSFTV